MLGSNFVRHIYADHNDSPKVRAIIRDLLASNRKVLNFGSGDTRLGVSVTNLDLAPGPNVDVTYDGRDIPFDDGHFDAVIAQEVLEHVQDLEHSVAEIRRVLRDGGLLYCQLPFILGYHSGPEDYRRFTLVGLREYFSERSWRVVETGVTVGAAVALYRIAVEFFAVLSARLIPAAYRPTKALFALVLYPLKWLDPLTRGGPNAHRIPGGIYAIVQRPGDAAPPSSTMSRSQGR
jgi:SAM-dependent methyltransferase